MESLINIKTFLAPSDGDGYGYGDDYGYGDGDGYGYGYGDGYGYGYGYGNGYGNGYGDGYGNGYGYGDGDGKGNGDGNGDGNGSLKSLQSLDGSPLYNIDDVPTAIDKVRGNVAKCRVLAADMTWRSCWMARVDNCWAHGNTLREAMRDAQSKAMASKPLDERLAMFREQYHTLDTKVPAKALYQWHNTLTGSCEFGRRQFCTDNNIDLDADYTVREFIDLTRGSYGGDIIKKLEKLYE